MSGCTIVSVTSELPALRNDLGAAALRVGDRLELTGQVGVGGFGEVAGARPGFGVGLPLVVKTLIPGIGDPSKAIRIVSELHRRLNNRSTPDWVERAKGFPYWSGSIRHDDGRVVPAFVSVDLNGLGYIALEEILDAGGGPLLELELIQRVELAMRFAATAALFEELGFVHADLNAPNIFVHLDESDVAVIDVDGGALLCSGDDMPTANGKADEFLAPELGDPLAAVPVNEESERWSQGITLSYLLLGTHPLFFLRSLGSVVIDQYLARFVWPAIDPHCDLVLPENAAPYTEWLEEVEELPSELLQVFRTLLAGFNVPSHRPSGWDWMLALQAGTPFFEEVSVSDATVVGDPVTVSWWAPWAASVEVGGQVGLPARGTVSVFLAITGPISLVARNAFGTAEASTASVAVLRVPQPSAFVGDLPTDRMELAKSVAEAVSSGLPVPPKVASGLFAELRLPRFHSPFTNKLRIPRPPKLLFPKSPRPPR